ncbi:MAG: hypothetical protein WBP64_09625 [Nitrososphaeraceae archaeon]
MNNLNILNLIKCKYIVHRDHTNKYLIILAEPATGILYITENSPGFISGHLRMRGKNGGRYPYRYLEMIDNIFGAEENTIEVCSGSIGKAGPVITTFKDSNSLVIGNYSPFTVDINPNMKPDLVADGQDLIGIPDGKFDRWRCDPPYNAKTAKLMYGTDLPDTIKLLKAGARVCKVGSLMFLLLGPQNYQWHPAGVKRIGYVNITVVPNNENRALNIFYKYGDC